MAATLAYESWEENILENLIIQAAEDLSTSQYAIALTGAGISTESAIRDFRGPQGIWTTDKQAEAKAYQRYELFLSNPKAYWEEMQGRTGTYGSFYTGLQNARPNPGHHALAELEKLGRIRCVVTQNIDGLHNKAGSQNVINYHGSVQHLRCPSCNARFRFGEIPLDELPPHCKSCGEPLKYDVVHFKEPIPVDVMQKAEDEARQCDLMLICGTSAVVYPFAALPVTLRQSKKTNAKIIEINAEPTPLTHQHISNYLIQGKTGEILPQLVEEVKRQR